MFKKVINKDYNGFTIVELLVVVAIIGILVAVSSSIINAGRQRDIARDAVLLTNLEKICASIRVYQEAENMNVPLEGNNNNPLDSTAASAPVLARYLSVWPEGFVYNSMLQTFAVHVQRPVSTNIYKCGSGWNGIRECAGTTNPENLGACNPPN